MDLSPPLLSVTYASAPIAERAIQVSLRELINDLHQDSDER